MPHQVASTMRCIGGGSWSVRWILMDFVAGLSYKMRAWSAGRLVRLHLELVRWPFHCSPPTILFRTSLQRDWSIWRFFQRFVVSTAWRVSNSGQNFGQHSCSNSCADSLTLIFLSTSWPSQARTALWPCFIVCLAKFTNSKWYCTPNRCILSP